MQQSGFTVLKNENWYVTTDSDKKILFTGLDDSMLGNVYMPDSTKIYDSSQIQQTLFKNTLMI